MDYKDCLALIAEDPEAMYVAYFGYNIYSFSGSVMRGFLLPCDHPDRFVRF